MNVVLGSASPRRQELLKRIYPEFTVSVADIDENLPDDIGSEFAPIYLAAAKSDVIAPKFHDSLVITADTVVICDGEIFGKPTDEEDARRMLRRLAGNTHKVITGCCVSYKRDCTCFAEESYVTFYQLTEREIDDYVASGEPMGKAGAYAIQGLGALLVEKIDGDFYNIVGLPIGKLKRGIQELLNQEEE